MLSCLLCSNKLPIPKLVDQFIVCEGCNHSYAKSGNGVWDFRIENSESTRLVIFQEPEFQRWLDIFGKIEIANWKIYETKLNRFFSQAGHRIISKTISPLLKENTYLVEIGAGRGELLQFIKVKNYIGIDTNWDALNEMAKLHKDATLICTSGGQLPIQDNHVDIIISLHTLEHIYHIGEFFEEINRILHTEGLQFFVIPCEGGFPFKIGRALITAPHLRKKYNLDVHYVMDREHINDANRIKKFLRMYFTNLKLHYWPLPFLPLLNTNVMIWGSCSKNDYE